VQWQLHGGMRDEWMNEWCKLREDLEHLAFNFAARGQKRSNPSEDGKWGPGFGGDVIYFLCPNSGPKI
jgi:hypothetical protein